MLQTVSYLSDRGLYLRAGAPLTFSRAILQVLLAGRSLLLFLFIPQFVSLGNAEYNLYITNLT